MNSDKDLFEVVGDIPDGWSYQWATVSILGSKSLADLSRTRMERDGWRPVPANRHPEMPSKDDQIEIGGCVLMERPVDATKAANKRDEQNATKLVTDHPAGGGKDWPFISTVGGGEYTEATASAIVHVTIPLRLSINQVTAASICQITPEEYSRRLILLLLERCLEDVLAPEGDAFELKNLKVTIGNANG